MKIIKRNGDTSSNQIKQTFNFVNLTYTKTSTNRLLLSSLQKDIIQVNTTVHCLSKELKAFVFDRNFFIIMFQLRSCLATLCNGINSLRIDINQISVISSQTLIPFPLNPLHHMSLHTKLETKLVSHPRLALPAWHSENIWHMYKYMKH